MSNYQYSGPPENPLYVPPEHRPDNTPKTPWYSSWKFWVSGLIVLASLGAILVFVLTSKEDKVALTPEQQFLTSLHTAYPNTVSDPDSNWLGLGKSVCTALDNGKDRADIVLILMDNAVSEEHLMQMSFAAGAAVRNFCPQYTSKMGG